MTLNGRMATFGAVSLFMGMSVTLMNLVLGGMLERFPRLKFVIVESGAGWLPFVVQGMEQTDRGTGTLASERRPLAVIYSQTRMR